MSDTDTYEVKVTFKRSLSADAGVLDKDPDKVTSYDLMQQFRKELQEAYDELAMDGSFKITEVRGEAF